jgi:hypothetical protein
LCQLRRRALQSQWDYILTLLVQIPFSSADHAALTLVSKCCSFQDVLISGELQIEIFGGGVELETAYSPVLLRSQPPFHFSELTLYYTGQLKCSKVRDFIL